MKYTKENSSLLGNYVKEMLCKVIMWFNVFISRKLTVCLEARRLVLQGKA